MGYRVDQELSLPPRIYGHEIKPEVLEVFGIMPDTPQAHLLLAQAAITGARYGGKWMVSVTHPTSPNEGLGRIWCEGGTEREEVIPTADKWIRESDATAWVPAPAIEIPIPEEYAPYEAHAVILVRGHEIPEDLLVKAQEIPEPTEDQVSPARSRRSFGLFRGRGKRKLKV